jgi:DHA1 family tetracycline resistance protein-like MFS transporter
MAFAWKRANPIGSLKLLLSHKRLTGLAVVDFVANVAHQVLPSVFVLYAAYRYGWGETAVGLTLAFVGVCSAIVQGLLIGPIVSRIGRPPRSDAGSADGCIGHGDLRAGADWAVVLSRRARDGAVGLG